MFKQGLILRWRDKTWCPVCNALTQGGASTYARDLMEETKLLLVLDSCETTPFSCPFSFPAGHACASTEQGHASADDTSEKKRKPCSWDTRSRLY